MTDDDTPDLDAEDLSGDQTCPDCGAGWPGSEPRCPSCGLSAEALEDAYHYLSQREQNGRDNFGAR